jgi:hypothetical protein
MNFFRVLGGKLSYDEELKEDYAQDEDEIPESHDVLKFESKFVKDQLTPHEPRLFCLVFNGNVVEYEGEGDSDAKGSNLESEYVYFK